MVSGDASGQAGQCVPKHINYIRNMPAINLERMLMRERDSKSKAAAWPGIGTSAQRFLCALSKRRW